MDKFRHYISAFPQRSEKPPYYEKIDLSNPLINGLFLHKFNLFFFYLLYFAKNTQKSQATQSECFLNYKLIIPTNKHVCEVAILFILNSKKGLVGNQYFVIFSPNN